MIDFDTFTKIASECDLDKLIVTIGFKNLPKVQKSTNLATLPVIQAKLLRTYFMELTNSAIPKSPGLCGALPFATLACSMES